MSGVIVQWLADALRTIVAGIGPVDVIGFEGSVASAS